GGRRRGHSGTLAQARAATSDERPLEPLERVRPALPVKFQACRGRERALIQDDAGARTGRVKRQIDQRLLVVGIGFFIDEREDEAAWSLDSAEGAADVEDIPLWRLHGDPVIGPLHRIELEALNGKSGGAPPAPELLCIDERGEDPLLGHDEDLLQMELRSGWLLGF